MTVRPISLLAIFLCLIVATATAGPPAVPDLKAHRQEFVNAQTGARCRAYNTDSLKGVEIWDEKDKKYVKDGVFLSLRSDKSVSEVTTWSRGLKHGKHEEYNEKKVLTCSGNYDENHKSGEWLRFAGDKGDVLSREQWKNGARNGQSIDYYTAGRNKRNPHIIQEYKDDKWDGAYEQYDDNGKKEGGGTYRMGSKEGTWSDYDWNGHIRAVQYINNQPAGKGP